MKLEVDALTYTYGDGTRVGPLSLSAECGILHLRGLNGAGKSTLMRVLGGMLPASSGSVRLGGLDPFVDHEVRAHIGAVAAASELPGFLTGAEAVARWAAFRGKAGWGGEEVLRGLDVPGRLRLDQMSSGQRRRAELAVALAGDPHLLLLDETFAHLDVQGVDWLVRTLEDGRHRRLVVLCHHGALPVTADAEVALASA
jgi:ABC-2 type transport system ATP-binding protein